MESIYLYTRKNRWQADGTSQQEKQKLDTHDNATKKAFKKELINKLINKYFEAFSIQEITGYYKDTKEDSYKIEVDG